MTVVFSIGSAANNSVGTTVSIPTGAIPAGSTIIVGVISSSSSRTISDSVGNQYSELAGTDSTNNGYSGSIGFGGMYACTNCLAVTGGFITVTSTGDMQICGVYISGGIGVWTYDTGTVESREVSAGTPTSIQSLTPSFSDEVFVSFGICENKITQSQPNGWVGSTVQDTSSASTYWIGGIQQLGSPAKETYTPVLSANDNTWNFIVGFYLNSPAVLNVATGSYTLTGEAASLFHSGTLPVATGTYALTGYAASLFETHLVLGATAGSYTLTGNAVSFLEDRVLTASIGSYTSIGCPIYPPLTVMGREGSYSLSEFIATLLWNHLLSADAGLYALTGEDSALLHGYPLSASIGAYTLTGDAASFVQDRVLPASTGAYTLAGDAASFVQSRILSASIGVNALTGDTATLFHNYVLLTDGGAYIVGDAYAFLRGYVLQADTGTYGGYGYGYNLGIRRILYADTGTYYETGEIGELIVISVSGSGSGFGGRGHSGFEDAPPEEVPDLVRKDLAGADLSELFRGMAVNRGVSQAVPSGPAAHHGMTTIHSPLSRPVVTSNSRHKRG